MGARGQLFQRGPQRGTVTRIGPGGAIFERRTQQFGPGVSPTTTQQQRAQENGKQLACIAGSRPNKSDYFLKDGTFVEAGTRCVKIRRRNPLNPRAASAAVRRIQGAKRAVGLINRISIRKACP